MCNNTYIHETLIFMDRMNATDEKGRLKLPIINTKLHY